MAIKKLLSTVACAAVVTLTAGSAQAAGELFL